MIFLYVQAEIEFQFEFFIFNLILRLDFDTLKVLGEHSINEIIRFIEAIKVISSLVLSSVYVFFD